LVVGATAAGSGFIAAAGLEPAPEAEPDVELPAEDEALAGVADFMHVPMKLLYCDFGRFCS
jgi:hypothetical protein